MDDHEEAGVRPSDCETVLRELYAFLDGELTSGRRQAIERHLGGCHDCIGAYDFEAELKIVIAARCHDEAPPTLRDRIADALERLDTEP
ncbi:MAG TPA: mycothiol system anti-sigma-R factor [Acidimicrobiales bacterium]|nr:mycothiol system anti-sigma-R factor [Acidimicrobiales bacterium]